MRYSHDNSFTDNIFYLFDASFQWVNQIIKANPRSFIDIETPEDNDTLVMCDGTLVTAVTIDGSSKCVLEDEFEDILDEADRKLMAYMSDGCHYISFYFSSDPDGIDAELEDTYGPVRRATNSIGLEMDDLIDEQICVLKKYCQKERSILLLWTNANGLSKDEKRVAKRSSMAHRKGMPLANDAQDIGMNSDFILTRHKSFVSEFRQDLIKVNVSTNVMCVHDFLREIRMSIDSQWTSDDWRPSLPGDPLPLRLDGKYDTDVSGMLWPRLHEQLFPRCAEHLDHASVKVGDTSFAPLTIELMPKSPEPFQSLFKRLNNEKVPWRINILIRNDGMSILGFKELLASYMQFTPGSPENESLVDVKKRLLELRKSGEEIVKLQISLCTWAPSKDKDLLDTRRAILARCVQGWGACDVAPAEGDPLETMMSSTPGAVLGSVGNMSASPLYDAIKMCPLTRPASPWKVGSQPLRTVDGKIIPYQPYSKLQAAWTTLIFAPMGYGKSMFMNSCNLSLILNPDNSELPFISILDVGPGSRGLISLLRGALPKEKRHFALYERLLNTREYAINVFDTKLGLRFPFSNQKAYLVNFLCYLATPDDQELPPDGILGMSDMVVDEAYKIYADRKSSKIYQMEILPHINDLLTTLEFKVIPGKTRWYDVVDFLSSKQYFHEAALAQRYAVPTLRDIAQIIKSQKIASIYSEANVDATGESLPQFFWRKITEAINAYPIISEETKFDLGEARVVSLDLDEVSKGHGPEAQRRTGLMYMVAYYVLTNHFFTGKEHLAAIPESVGLYKVDYRPYHKRYLESIKKLPKRFCCDEKQRIKDKKMIVDQFDESIREGRKWKIEIMQASQLPDDFSEDSVRLATNIFILGGGNKVNCEKVAKTFKLSPTMTQHLYESLSPPNKHGAKLLSILETERGSFEQLLMSTHGPIFLWACNSSSDDGFVRDTLSAEIGDIEARSLLVEKYPSGNLDEEIEKRAIIQGLSLRKKAYQGEDLSNRHTESDETPKGILTDIIKDLLALYYARNEQAVSNI